MGRLRRLPPTVRHLLLVIALGSPLLTPLLRWTAVACTHDGHLHYHRIAAMRHAWENGLLFTRWLPDLAFGYGYPFFVYREATPLYLPFFPHLAGLPLPAASNLFYALTILACGWFTYLWVRDVLGVRAALVSAVAYMAAPYVLVDALIRGNSPESLALPLFPLLLWAGRRWLLANGRFQSNLYFLLAVFGLAFLSLSHNISTLIFTPTLLVYLAALAWLHRLRWQTAALRIALLFGLGLGMTLFYTGGALLEMDQVTLQQSTTTRNNDFRYNFASLVEVLAPVAPEDPQLLNPPLLFRLGWTVVALALVGCLLTIFDWRLARRAREAGERPSPGRERRFHVSLMAAGTAVYLFMALPASRPVWESLPLIDFVQFPWRFVGRAALPVAFLAGVPFADSYSVIRDRYSVIGVPNSVFRAGFYAAIALLLVESFPNLYPNICSEKAFPTINDVHDYERVTGLVGVDPEGSYFPRTVAKRPRSSPLEADFLAGQTPQRFDLTALPDGAMAQEVTYGRLSATMQLNSPTPFTARYLSFAFPGWEAAVDGTAVPITPSDPEGLITFPVPAGEHTLTVRWTSTPLRTGLVSVSLLALLLAVVVVARNRYSVIGNRYSDSDHEPPFTAHRSPLTAHRLPLTAHRSLLLLAVALLAAKLMVDRVQSPLRRAAVPAVTHAVTLQGGELRLEGYNLSRATVDAGGTFDVDMAWTTVAAPQVDYQTNLWLVGPEGLTWSEKGTPRPRLYEDAPQTRLWQPGQWAWDSREVQVFAGTPPGTYDLVLTLFDKETLQPVTLIAADGVALGPTAVLGQVAVTMPEAPPDFAPRTALTAALPELGATLLGVSLDRDAAAPGMEMQVILFWERDAAAGASRFALALEDNAGTAVRSWEFDITRTDFIDWQPGQRLRGQYLLRLPAGLESGVYHFVLQERVSLGALDVSAPLRLFTQPEIETAVGVTYFDANGAPIATLTGYTLTCDPSPATCRLDLLWQAADETPISYRVFVHLVNESGQLLAQSDGEPAGWTRPTTGWAPGEFVGDLHQLSPPSELPSGSLALRVGLYDPDTGARLAVEGDEFITISLP